MDAAKSAVNKIIGRSGQHDTTVDEHVRPAVTEEVIKPHRHEETTQAIDREVHQDHYHTTVQPLTHKEVLAEKHTHQQAPLQEREFRHGDSDKIRANVEREVAQFGDTQRVHQTTSSQSQGATVAGEHVHHHVHEVVQPVIHKETVQPEVVHTTIPIHETHHAQSEHHGISTLPVKSLDEFKKIGGAITGGSHRHEEYEGHPRPYNPELQSARSPADRDPAAHDGSRSGLTGTTGTTGGLTGTSGTTGGLSGTSGSHTGSGLTGSHTGSGLTSSHGSGLTGSHGTSSTSGTSGTTRDLGDNPITTTGGHTTRSNVSGVEHSSSTGTGLSSAGAGATGTALGGRAEGNTASRALDAVSGHGSSGVSGSHTGTGTGFGSSTTGTSGVGSEGVTGRGLEHAATGYGSTGLTGSHQDRGLTDTSSSTNSGRTGNVSDDVQSPRQGKDPNLVETGSRLGGLKGEGVDGSHSAVFGLTPDGHKHDDTSHTSGTLRPAHSKASDSIASTADRGDTGSRAPTGSGIASQLNDPRVAERGHGGSAISDQGSAKIGAGHPGGEQGFGTIRPQEHGGTTKLQDKLDPRTDADGDGKRGFMD